MFVSPPKRGALITYMCVNVCVCIYIYIYRERERERERKNGSTEKWENGSVHVYVHACIYIYMCVCVCIYIYVCVQNGRTGEREERENGDASACLRAPRRAVNGLCTLEKFRVYYPPSRVEQGPEERKEHGRA
jgi:hypothetical protein